MRKSSRGNPYHDDRGRFCSANQVKTISEKTEEQYQAETENRKLEAECTFSPAKTIEEAETFTRSLGVEPSFNGFTLKQCNETNKALQETLVEFPQVKIRKVTSTQSYGEARKQQDRAERTTYYTQKGMDERKAYSLAQIEIDMKASLMGENTVVICNQGELFINPNSDGSFKKRLHHAFGHMIAYAHVSDGGKEFAEVAGIETEITRSPNFNYEELMAKGWAELKTEKRPSKTALAVGEYLRNKREKHYD